MSMMDNSHSCFFAVHFPGERGMIEDIPRSLHTLELYSTVSDGKSARVSYFLVSRVENFFCLQKNDTYLFRD